MFEGKKESTWVANLLQDSPPATSKRPGYVPDPSELIPHFRVFFSLSTNVTVAGGDRSGQQGPEEDEDPLPVSTMSQELLHEERRHGPLQVRLRQAAALRVPLLRHA